MSAGAHRKASGEGAPCLGEAAGSRTAIQDIGLRLIGGKKTLHSKPSGQSSIYISINDQWSTTSILQRGTVFCFAKQTRIMRPAVNHTQPRQPSAAWPARNSQQQKKYSIRQPRTNWFSRHAWQQTGKQTHYFCPLFMTSGIIFNHRLSNCLHGSHKVPKSRYLRGNGVETPNYNLICFWHVLKKLVKEHWDTSQEEDGALGSISEVGSSQRTWEHPIIDAGFSASSWD